MNNLEGKERDKYFGTVNLDDPDFQMRDINVQVDGAFSEAFGEIFNFVSQFPQGVYQWTK
ncbi:MAG: hypothetical protein IPO07_29585 [Haliscomenobacter sp.]|nr:hypothetical protein [Haliscomenobacter sp.]MBK9492482.1 hypothetical protein [Haliscomenobacter sp.]